jgi:hypothetical protein
MDARGAVRQFPRNMPMMEENERYVAVVGALPREAAE